MLDEVEFAYGKTPVLRGVTARVLPGQMVAFVGPSGAGKSTLLNLFMRFYDPSGGAVRLDGIDVRSVRLADLRKHIALVPQDSMILPMTVAANIAYGRPSATDEEIRAAAELACADTFIEQMPDGYQTMLSEGGGNLSGGQRQRIAIARALLSQAPILILDEPTSALDPAQESMIIETLHHMRGRRTIILVTHHLRSVEEANRIYVLDAGQVIEQGNHASLVAEEGLYAQLLRQDSPEDGIPYAA
jgi:ATP-binding cassette subfamily B protein